MKKILPLLLSAAIALIASSCRADSTGSPTATIPAPMRTNPVLLPAETTQALAPSKTPEPARSPSPTTPPSAQPASTTFPATPLCFTARDTNLFAFMPDGTRIAIRAGGGVQIFNLKTLQEESFIQAPQNIVAAAASPDGQRLAWSLKDNTLQLVRTADKKVLSTLRGHTDMVGKLRFSPQGDRLYSASHDTWVRVWDASGKLLDAFQPAGADSFPSQVLGIGVSPDGKQLATIPLDGPVKIWNLSDKTEAQELGGSGGYDTSDAAFSPDGHYVAADLATGLSLWRMPDRTQLLDGINSMAFAFSPDGRYLVYADIANDYKVLLTTADGKQPIRTLEGLPAPIWELVFSPDGSLLASGGVEIRVWRVEDGKLAYVGKPACP